MSAVFEEIKQLLTKPPGAQSELSTFALIGSIAAGLKSTPGVSHCSLRSGYPGLRDPANQNSGSSRVGGEARAHTPGVKRRNRGNGRARPEAVTRGYGLQPIKMVDRVGRQEHGHGTGTLDNTAVETAAVEEVTGE